MQGKRKLCERYTRIFLLLKKSVDESGSVGLPLDYSIVQIGICTTHIDFIQSYSIKLYRRGFTSDKQARLLLFLEHQQGCISFL